MTKKAKTFDCVEMKNRIQAERWAEYQARKGEFRSYLDFITARVVSSQLGQVVRDKVAARSTDT